MFRKRDVILSSASIQTAARYIGGLFVLAGVVTVVTAPFLSAMMFDTLWGIEPLAYIGVVLVMVGLGVTSLSYVVPSMLTGESTPNSVSRWTTHRWSQITQQNFELFHHDLGRPLRRILGKERELRAILKSSGVRTDPAVKELLDEIESQVPSFRLMMSNIQVLVDFEGPKKSERPEGVEPSELVRRIVDRYTPVAAESRKEITWWAEPFEFGIIYSSSSAVEHTGAVHILVSTSS